MARIMYTPACIILLSLSYVYTRSPTSDLLDIYRQQLDHDINWDDNVDGSYDVDTIRTKFRAVNNGLAWIITSTPFSAQPGLKNIHQEMPLYQQYNRHTQVVTDTTEAPEVEIVLGKDDEDDNDNDDNDSDNDADDNDDEDNDDEETTATTQTTTTTTEATTTAAMAKLVIQPGRPIVTAPARLAHRPAHLPAPTYDLAKRTDADQQQTDKTVANLAVPITIGCLGSVLFGGVIAFLLQRRSRSRKASFDEEQGYGYGYGYGISQPIPPRKPSKGLTLDLTNDRLLAKSAETYHYQQQRRSMISSSGSSSRSGSLMHGRLPEHSDYDTEEEEVDEGVATQYGDYTVFECPGLAAPGEFEVVNPLFADQNESVIEVVNAED